LDPARIYVVDPKDKARVLDDLQELFSGLTLDSRKVIRHIYRREDIYSGPFLDEAPDLILIGNDGFDLKAGLKADKLADKGIFTGRHTLDDAFLLLAGSPCKDMMPQSPDVCCVKPIIDKLAKG
jgi:predicted AlkP superfamily phosphohydrolase/phosphomutase